MRPEWRRSRWTQSPDRPPPARLGLCIYNRIFNMRFVWDPTKSTRNLAKRQFDFRVSNRHERKAYTEVFPAS